MCKTQTSSSSSARQNAMLVTVTSIAKKLLTYTTTQSFDETVTDCLCMLGETLGQDRVFIWKDIRNANNMPSCIQIYEWVQGVQSIQGVEAFENIPYDDLPSFRDALDRGKCLNQLVCLLSPSERDVLEPQGIQTILIAPITIDGVRWGFIGVDNCRSQELFTQHDENMLLTSGFMLASAILKQATEDTLRQSEELVQAMFDATPLCCSVWDSGLNILTCNEGAVKLFGLKDKQDFINNFLSLSPLLQPCGRPSQVLILTYISEAFRTGRCEFEWQHQKPDGSYLPVHVTLVRIRYKNEDAVAGYARDLSELKKQEAKRREAEERTQLMVNAMPLCCNFWDKDFNNVVCNDEAVRLFELNSQQEYLENFSQLSPEFQPDGSSSAKLAKEKIQQAFSEGYARFEWMHQRLDGTPIPAEVTLIRMMFQNEYSVVGYTRDLSELKKQEAHRRAAEERTQLMVNAMPLSCNFWDKDFNNIACNDEAVRLFELNSQQEYLDNFPDLSPEFQPDGSLSAEAAKEKIIQAFSLGYVRFEWLHQRLDGTPIPAEVTLIRLLFQNEYIVVGYTRDLRAHKAMLAEVQSAQQKLALARDEALALSKAKSEFLANMSHEVRTPMNGILGLSYLALQSPDMTPPLRQYVAKIEDSAKSLLRIINDILDFSKISAGKLDIEHTSFNMPHVLEHAIHPLIPTIMDKGLELYLDISQNFPMQLMGDAVRLRQVLLNLVTNAVKFTHKGTISIRVEPASFPAAEFLLRFIITDTGVGIEPSYLAQLFEPFTQADSSVTRRYGGTGLGLAICKQLVDLMGGEISATSTVGKGSEFVFTACFGMVDATQDTSDPAPIPPCLHGKRVLIMDEHDLSCEILTRYLCSIGIEPTCVPNGPAALAALAEQARVGRPSHAVLLDWNAPDNAAANVIHTVRSGEVAPAPGLVVMAYNSADISPALQKIALNGVDAVLPKPVIPAQLYKSLHTALEAAGLVPCTTAAPAMQRTSPARKARTPLSGKRVLLAEDNEINTLIAVEILRGFGMNVTTAATGLETLNRALAEPFDVILMDIQMPEMDGIEATKRIRRQLPGTDNIPIIAMTAHAMSDDYEKSITAGMQAHITKPIDPEVLYKTLVHWTT